jgi:hypothetical protein
LTSRSNCLAKLKPQLNGLIKKLADLGINGVGELATDEYQGVLRKDLASTLKGNAACKLKIFDRLQKIIPSGSEDNRTDNPPVQSPTVNENVTSYGQTGGITAHTVIVGTPKLTFDPTVAAQIVRSIPTTKPVALRSVGSASDHAVANQYQAFLKQHGYHVSRALIGMMFASTRSKDINYLSTDLIRSL